MDPEKRPESLIKDSLWDAYSSHYYPKVVREAIKYYNNKYNYVGHVFKSRYTREFIENDEIVEGFYAIII